MEILDQTVWITVVGMGLTFAAIGLLVLAMIALTRWTREEQETAPVRKKPTDVVYPRGAIPIDESLEELEQAAAVAVAVALALAARRAHPTQAWHTARPEEDPSPWQAYSRGQQLEQRKTHQTLRW